MMGFRTDKKTTQAISLDGLRHFYFAPENRAYNWDAYQVCIDIEY